MLISLLVSVLSYQYGPDLVVFFFAFYALVKGVLVNPIHTIGNSLKKQKPCTKVQRLRSIKSPI